MTESWSANFKPLGSLAHVGLSSRHTNAIANHRLCALLFQFNKGKFIPSNGEKGKKKKSRRLWLPQEQKMPKSISCELVFSDGEADPSWCEANLYKKTECKVASELECWQPRWGGRIVLLLVGLWLKPSPKVSFIPQCEEERRWKAGSRWE